LDVRRLSAALNDELGFETVPICQSDLLLRLPGNKQSLQTVMQVALTGMPLPGETVAWRDIFDFKTQARDKQWGFRRFLTALSTKQQTPAEIRDDIEWTANEYAKAKEIHHIKASQSFVEIFVISPLEIIENLVKLNWSKPAKGALSIQKRKIDLMEAEMKAPDRECAYVFDARKRFEAK
jgi:hypothetical protein